jgi:hypothetical protein
VALSNEDLQQIRAVVRSEIEESSQGRWFYYYSSASRRLLLWIFITILALHVLVIGGFTIYHWMHIHAG